MANVIIDALEFDEVYSRGNDIIHVSADVYAIAYERREDVGGTLYSKGYIKTVRISDSGDIGEVIDSLKYSDTGARHNGRFPSIIHVTGSIYAIAYASVETISACTCVATVQIQDNGQIGGAVIDTAILEAWVNVELAIPHIIHVSGEVYAIIYRNSGGTIKTITIDAGGTIGAVIDTFTDVDVYRALRITHIAGTVYAMVGEGAKKNTWYYAGLKTVTINDDGTFPVSPVIDTLDLGDFWLSSYLKIIHITGNIYAIVHGYYTPVGGGAIKTVEIAIDGQIGDELLDSGSFDTYYGFGPDVVLVENNVIGIAYHAIGLYPCWGRFIKMGVTDGGQIVGDPGGWHELGGDAVAFETAAHISFPSVIQVAPKIFAVAYKRDDNDHGWLKSLGMGVIIAPTVTTDQATGLGAVLATLNGTLDSDGGEICQCGFEWGLDTGYGVTTPAQSKTTGETFSQIIHGLFPGTVYHFRAFATNSVGTAYGSDETFTTALVVSRAFALAREEL